MSFEIAMQVLLAHEGGFSNDAADHGGATNHGITQAELALWRGHGVTIDDVKNLSVAEASQIYKVHYWDVMQLDAVQSGIMQLALFDNGVLNGPQTVVLALQQLLMVNQDGIMGPDTLAATNGYIRPQELVMKLLCEMQMRYVDIVKRDASQIVFLSGWLHRTQDLMIDCVT